MHNNHPSKHKFFLSSQMFEKCFQHSTPLLIANSVLIKCFIQGWQVSDLTQDKILSSRSKKQDADTGGKGHLGQLRKSSPCRSRKPDRESVIKLEARIVID